MECMYAYMRLRRIVDKDIDTWLVSDVVCVVVYGICGDAWPMLLGPFNTLAPRPQPIGTDRTLKGIRWRKQQPQPNCVSHGEGKTRLATPRNQNKEQPSRGQPRGAVQS